MEALQEGRNSGARRPNLISVMISLSLLSDLAFFVGGVDSSSWSAERDDDGPAAR